MSHRMQLMLVGLVCLLLGIVIAPQLPFASAQAKAGKDPVWSHAMNLRSRKSTETDFTDKTQRFGIEVFRDEVNGNLIYISESGSISVVHK